MILSLGEPAFDSQGDRRDLDKVVLEVITLAFLPVLAAVPTTLTWSPKVAAVMILCNILAIAIGKFTIKYPSVGPAMPSPNLFGGFGLGAVLGTTSFGHLIGAGVILGLANLGVL